MDEGAESSARRVDFRSLNIQQNTWYEQRMGIVNLRELQQVRTLTIAFR
jgi:hypothetical protein